MFQKNTFLTLRPSDVIGQCLHLYSLAVGYGGKIVEERPN